MKKETGRRLWVLTAALCCFISGIAVAFHDHPGIAIPFFVIGALCLLWLATPPRINQTQNLRKMEISGQTGLTHWH